MKIKSENKYTCDKCGEKLLRSQVASLSTNFAPTGLVGYKQGNMGVRHLCSYCKKHFTMAFKGFFSNYNSVLKSHNKIKTYE